jgi:hypothetical protein
MRIKIPVEARPITGEQLRFYVNSQVDPDVMYIVDLAMNKGHGECQCKRFTCVSKPRLDAGEPSFTDRTSCAHIRACWQWWLRQSLKP